MNPSYEAELIQRRMQEVRYELDSDVEQIVESARASADWRYYFNQYPWAFLGAAAAVGFVIVPRSFSSLRSDSRELLDLVRKEGFASASPSPSPAAPPPPSAAASLTGMLTSMATRGLMTYGMQMLSNYLMPPPPPAPHESNGHHEHN